VNNLKFVIDISEFYNILNQENQRKIKEKFDFSYKYVIIVINNYMCFLHKSQNYYKKEGFE